MGKTSTQETTQEIDKDLRREAEQSYSLAHMISGLGYNPYQGLDVAARSPKELAADEAANTAASAFGMGTRQPLATPPPMIQDGIAGYSTQQMAQAQPGYADLQAKIAEIFQRGANDPMGGGAPAESQSLATDKKAVPESRQ